MCGLAGFVSVSQIAEARYRPALIRALNAIKHRGPDDRGVFFDSHVALGHNRLSIIDLSPRGRQPMASIDAALQVVFNGEIYNFKQLKSELVQAGHRFGSDTDTEVLVYGYREWGFRGLLDRIEGMFAFALWDANARALFFARDPFGIKPLYYSRRDDGSCSHPSSRRSSHGTRPLPRSTAKVCYSLFSISVCLRRRRSLRGTANSSRDRGSSSTPRAIH